MTKDQFPIYSRNLSGVASILPQKVLFLVQNLPHPLSHSDAIET